MNSDSIIFGCIIIFFSIYTSFFAYQIVSILKNKPEKYKLKLLVLVTSYIVFLVIAYYFDLLLGAIAVWSISIWFLFFPLLPDRHSRKNNNKSYAPATPLEEIIHWADEEEVKRLLSKIPDDYNITIDEMRVLSGSVNRSKILNSKFLGGSDDTYYYFIWIINYWVNNWIDTFNTSHSSNNVMQFTVNILKLPFFFTYLQSAKVIEEKEIETSLFYFNELMRRNLIESKGAEAKTAYYDNLSTDMIKQFNNGKSHVQFMKLILNRRYKEKIRAVRIKKILNKQPKFFLMNEQRREKWLSKHFEKVYNNPDERKEIAWYKENNTPRDEMIYDFLYLTGPYNPLSYFMSDDEYIRIRLSPIDRKNRLK